MSDTPTTKQRNQLEDALLKAFNRESLRRMARRELGLPLEHELDLQRGLKFIITDLVDLAIEGGWIDQLVRGARRDNQGNPWLKKAAMDLAVTELPPPVPEDLREARLEKLVRERAPFLKWDEFLKRFSAMGPRVCRIEVPEGTHQGTGWLVGPDLLLTNYHVVEAVIKQHIAAADVACRFDYTEDASIAGESGGTVCRLAPQWLVDSSPYSASDLQPLGTDPLLEELDYALLRLQVRIGDSPAGTGSDPRGWIMVPENPPVVMADDIVLIAQHPQGRSLELAFGMVLTYNSNGTRLRYDVNTEKGSSGSPCFDLTLTPFGLHHAGGPGEKFLYNQCVPLRRVVALLQGRQMPAFWKNS
jgi:hypothetical protein